jgi:hypothetical protein
VLELRPDGSAEVIATSSIVGGPSFSDPPCFVAQRFAFRVVRNATTTFSTGISLNTTWPGLSVATPSHQ